MFFFLYHWHSDVDNFYLVVSNFTEASHLSRKTRNLSISTKTFKRSNTVESVRNSQILRIIAANFQQFASIKVEEISSQCMLIGNRVMGLLGSNY